VTHIQSLNCNLTEVVQEEQCS